MNLPSAFAVLLLIRFSFNNYIFKYDTIVVPVVPGTYYYHMYHIITARQHRYLQGFTV